MLRRWIVWLTLCLALVPVEAARLTFNDGTVLDGKIKSVTSEKIILEYDFGEVERLRRHVVSITNLAPAEEALLNAAPRAGSVGSSQGGPQRSGGEEGGSQAAYESLRLLKDRLEAGFARERNNLMSDFARERTFLEENLEALAERYNDLKNKWDDSQTRDATRNARVDQLTRENDELRTTIISLRNEISLIQESRLQSEVAVAEKIQNAIARNRELFENEKQSLRQSHEGQLAELEKQMQSLNMRTLELARENVDLGGRLATLEKENEKLSLSRQDLDRELQQTRETMENRIKQQRQDEEDRRMSLEQLLATSADTLSQTREDHERLQNENRFLKNQLEEKEAVTQGLNQSIEQLLAENEQFKKEVLENHQKLRAMNAERDREKEMLLQSIVDSVMVESGNSDLTGLAREARQTLLEAREAAKLEAARSRSSLFELFQGDISKLRAQLREKEEALAGYEALKAGYQTELQSAASRVQEVEESRRELDARVQALHAEQTALRDEMKNRLTNLREESRLNLDQERNRLQQEYEGRLAALKTEREETARRMQASPFVPAPVPHTPVERLSPPPPLLPAGAAGLPLPGAVPGSEMVRLTVGVISQIEKDFNRVYIDTRETLREGDQIFTETASGEFPFQVVKVYQALNGAIAEIQDPARMEDLVLNAAVYVKG